MIFSSITFLYYFLPFILICYYVVPNRFKNAILLTASLVFYAWGEPKFLFVMVGAILLGYILGLLIHRYQGQLQAKIFFILACVLSIAMIGYFKYANFFVESFMGALGMTSTMARIALPIGISFFTFQILSYVIDIYKGDSLPKKSLISFATYISMFPQLIAGPIVRYGDVEEQLDHREMNCDLFYAGIQQFLVGLCKKVLIANVLGTFCASFKTIDDRSILLYWMYGIVYSLHIYFDFSGYSDMAIGLGKLFGFHFPKNFNYPFISSSIAEFWRRWHISLGTWFKDYVYIPLGGNRCSNQRWIFNVFVVWGLTGLWHGAAWNFVLWGILFACLLLLEKFVLQTFLQTHKHLSRVYVLVLIMISFIIFDATSMNMIIENITGLISIGTLPLCNEVTLYYLRSYFIVIVVAVIGATPIVSMLYKKIERNKVVGIVKPVVLIGALLVVTSFLVAGSFNPFLYFRF